MTNDTLMQASIGSGGSQGWDILTYYKLAQECREVSSQPSHSMPCNDAGLISIIASRAG